MTRRCVALLLSAVIAGGIAVTAPIHTISAQAPPQVFFVDSVRNKLAREWRENDPTQHERAYCITWEWGKRGRLEGIFVTGIRRASEQESTQEAVVYDRCPSDPRVTTLHIHTPNTCEETLFGLHCVAGGMEAHLCSPSELDGVSLYQTGQLFAVIQCARDALVPFWTLRGHFVADSLFRARWAKGNP